MKYLIYTKDQALDLASLASYKTYTQFIDFINPNNQPGRSKEFRNQIKLPTNRIILPWPICTEPRLREEPID